MTQDNAVLSVTLVWYAPPHPPIPRASPCLGCRTCCEEGPGLCLTCACACDRSDPPPLPGSEMALVNDLDLVVSNDVSVGWVNGKVCSAGEGQGEGGGSGPGSTER